MLRRGLRTVLPTIWLCGFLVCEQKIFAIAKDASSDAKQVSSETLFTPEQLDFFEQEGYLVISGLLDKEELEDLVSAGENVVQLAEQSPYQTFTVVEKGILFTAPNSTCFDESCLEAQKITKAFRGMALRSKLAQACAELMHLDPLEHSLRIIRDVFLAKPVDAASECDWHVDDQSFWPQSFLEETGINVWIAMDDMPYEGSMAVVPKSHKAEWRHDGYRAIGQDRTTDGFTTKQELLDMLKSGDFNTTCSMQQADPELQAQVETSKAVFNLKKGDIIFATRLLYHRTIPVTAEGKEYYEKIGKKTLNRYSVRFVPGSARLPTKYNLELSLVATDANHGRTLDEVDEKDGPWYPRAWPTVDKDIDERLDALVRDRLPAVKQAVQVEHKALMEKIRAMQEEKKKTDEL